jgi:Bifunctional DNA primase/polymerase, N-terminal
MSNQTNFAEEANPADAAPAPLPQTPAGIPFVMTNDMKVKLAALGWTTEDIANMMPAEGHKLIGDGTAKPAQSTQTPRPYAQVGARLIERGYCALRVPRGLKHPNIKDWLLTYAHRMPTQEEIDGWSASGAGVGIVTGAPSSEVIGVDIDTDDPAIVAAIRAVLSISGTVVKKRGAKGETIFGRCPGLKDKSFNINGARVCDLLANGRFCVLPATVHPDTHKPYVWLTTDTLENTDPSELPEFPADLSQRIATALAPFGYAAEPVYAPIESGGGGDSDSAWSRLNERALANLSAWVPALQMPRCRRKAAGYEAVAHWRPSSTGRPLEKRDFNLSLVPQGIRDFGDHHGYSPIDLVMAAQDCDFDTAFCWLDDLVGEGGNVIDLELAGEEPMTYASLNEAEAAATIG